MFRSSALSIQFTPLVPIHHQSNNNSNQQQQVDNSNTTNIDTTNEDVAIIAHNNKDNNTSSSSSASYLPRCNLLKLENLTILCDCGGTPTFENDFILNAIAPHAKDIDAILISSSEMVCCGSLPQVLPMLRPGVKVLATMATARVGILGVSAQFLSVFGNADGLMSRVSNLPARPAPPQNLSVKSIYRAFRSITEIHFDQLTTVLSIEHAIRKEQEEKRAMKRVSSSFSGNNNNIGNNSNKRRSRKLKNRNRNLLLQGDASAGLDQQQQQQDLLQQSEVQHATIRAVSAGRILGASGFRIKYRDDDICYFGDRFSPRDSFVIPGVNVASALNGANILICDGSAANLEEKPPLSAAEDVLKAVRETLRKGGTALLPTNAFGVGIDLMQKLETYFQEELGSYQLVFASPKAREHVDRLRLLSEFSVSGSNWGSEKGPFSTYKLVTTPADFPSLEKAKCVVCHTIDMKDSLTCAFLQDVVKDSRNMVLFTDPTSCAVHNNNNNNDSSVRDKLLAFRDKNYKESDELRISCRIRTILEGEDLEAFREEDKAKRDAEEKAARLAEEKKRQVEAATELSLLNTATTLITEEDDDGDENDNDNNNQEKNNSSKSKSSTAANNSNNTTNKKTQQQQLLQQDHHPKLFVSKCFDIKKRVKANVLNFPGELSVASSSRVLQDFTGTSSNNNNNAASGSNNNDDSSAVINMDSRNNNNYDDERVWGIPLSESELRRFRRFEAESNYSSLMLANTKKNNNSNKDDDGDDQNTSGTNNNNNNNNKRSSESQDEVPAYVRDHELVMKRLLCKIDFIDASQWLDGTSFRVLLRTSCTTVKKITFLNTTTDDARALVNFCTSEDVVRVLKRKKHEKESSHQPAAFEQNIFCPQQDDQVELATAVFSCEIKLHPSLLNDLAQAQRTVNTHSGSWQVAWTRGNLKKSVVAGDNNDNNNNENSENNIPSRKTGAVRRQRDEEREAQGEGTHQTNNNDTTTKTAAAALPILCPIDDENDNDAAAHQYQEKRQQQQQQRTTINHHESGSIFVGELKLPLIERELKRKNHIGNISIELDDQAPLLVANNSVAIRGINYKNKKNHITSGEKDTKNRNENDDDQSDDDNDDEFSASSSSLAMEAVPCAAWFAARKAFKGSFSHIL